MSCYCNEFKLDGSIWILCASKGAYRPAPLLLTNLIHSFNLLLPEPITLMDRNSAFVCFPTAVLCATANDYAARIVWLVLAYADEILSHGEDGTRRLARRHSTSASLCRSGTFCIVRCSSA